MPLHGKIVVIKRSGLDGCEFPLTASCLFGRKPDCDIRIQLAQVSKEHCRIDLNENKEVILTNLSSVNPTCVNGEVLQQSERLKHGDVITIIDRSFRFEYPPAPTPKKRRSSIANKAQQDQQTGQINTVLTEEKKKTDLTSDTCLKDGTNTVKLLQKTSEVAEEEGSLDQSKTASPFCELYQMVKKSLDSKTTWKPPGSQPQTPLSRVSKPKPVSTKKAREEESGIPSDVQSPAKKPETQELLADTADREGKSEEEVKSGATPKSSQKKSLQVQPAGMNVPAPAEQRPMEEAAVTTPIQGTPKDKRRASKPGATVEACAAPAEETTENPKTPTRRRSKAEPELPTHSVTFSDDCDTVPVESQPSTPKTEPARSLRTSPRTAERKLRELETTVVMDQEPSSTKKRRSEELGSELAVPKGRRKSVSFGGHLRPELFDKRLPPDSPLRKGATPRRSLCVTKNNTSLLRRASVIGLVKTPSPAKKSKAKTPSPAKEKSPKTKTKTPSPGKQETKTPSMQGRFSVSRVSTPSPVMKQDSTPQKPVAATPGVRRKSMKAVKKTPRNAMKSAVEVLRNRRSGVSRASMKVVNSWADIVKFGQTKSQNVVPTKKTIKGIKTKKAPVPKPKTPARNHKDQVSTGHADSPVTIVVGKAHKLKTVQPTGAAPKLVYNTVLLQKNRKMDEDLTGIAEIFNTPAPSRQRKSIASDQSSLKTPQTTQSTLIETSVMNTPEETGEMLVSPLSVVSTAKPGIYNSDAVSRLLQDNQECSFIGEVVTEDEAEDSPHSIPALEMPSEEQVSQTEISTPKQKPEQPDCLTGVKRIMKTPRQKVEPVEDLRGNIMKTPKQKPEQIDCLTGVKRIMKTPRQRVEPVEDLRGKLLKTPRAPKGSEEAGLDGVKELLATPKHKEEPVDLPELGDETKTLMVESSPLVCATGIEEATTAPKDEGVPVEDVKGVTQTPMQELVQEETISDADCVSDLATEEPQLVCGEEVSVLSDDLQSSCQTDNVEPPKMEDTEMATEHPQVVCEEHTEDVSVPSEDMQTPSQTDAVDPPKMEDTELAAEQQVVCEEHMEDVSVPSDDGQTTSQTDAVDPPKMEDKETELAPEQPQVVCEEQMEDVSVPSDDMQNSSQIDAVDPPKMEDTEETELATEQPQVVCEEHTEDVSVPSDDMQSSSQTDAVDPLKMEDTEEKVEAISNTSTLKTTEETLAEETLAETAQDPEPAESKEATAPTVLGIGRRGKKSEVIVPTLPTPVRQSGRRRAAQSDVTKNVDVPVETMEVLAPEEEPLPDPDHASKPKRGRKAKQSSVEKTETEQENSEATSDEIPPAEKVESLEQTLDVPVEKPRRGRKPKQNSTEQTEVVPEETTESVCEKVPAMRARRGRKPQQEAVEKNVEAVETPPIEGAGSKEASSVPAMTDPKDEGVPVEDVKGVTQTSMQELVQEETISADCVSDLATEQPQLVCGEEVSVPSDDLQSSSQTDNVEPPKMEDTEMATEHPQVVCEEQMEDVSVPSDDMQSSSQTDAVDPLKMEDTEETVEATSNTSTLKTTEETLAETAQDPEPAESKEATAPTVLGRGRRGKKTEVIVPTLPTPVRQSGRRRAAQSDVTKNVDVPVETMEVLAPEEEPLPDPDHASKPKRGRKAKQSSVEKTETEQENSEATSDEIPPAEKVESLEQILDVPVEKPRRGRKPKLNSKQTEVVPISTDCVSDLATEQPLVVCEEAVSVPSDDLQSTSQTDAVDPPKMEDTELATEQPASVPLVVMETKVEATNNTSTLKTLAETAQDPEPTESKEATAPTVLGRGRRGKKTEVIVPTLPVKPAGRRRAAQSDVTKNVDVPVETMEVLTPEEEPLPDPDHASKPKRGRKAKQSSVEKTETEQENSEATSDEIPPAEKIESLEQTLDVPVEKPRRGRKPKQNSTEQTEVVPEETTETVCEKVPAMRARRGRKPQQEAVEANVEAVETPPTEGAGSKEASSVPAEKPRRGQKAKPDPVESAEGTVEEILVDEKVEVQAPVVRARRGRKTPQEAVEKEAVPVDIPQTESVDAKEPEVQAPVSKARRGRKTKQDSLEQVEDECAPAEAPVALEPTASPAEKPKRGGRRKRNAVEPVEDPGAESATEDEAQELVAVVLEKPKRARMAKREAETEAAPAPAPADERDETCAAAAGKPKRGPRAKQDVPVHEKKEEANAKPGRGRKVIPDEEEEQAAPAKRARRGATAPTAAEATGPAAKSTTRRAGKAVSKAEADVPAEVVAAPVKRSTRGAKKLVS